MYTAPEVAAHIRSTVVTRFATLNGIEPSHLEAGSDTLTAVEALRAYRALGFTDPEGAHP